MSASAWTVDRLARRVAEAVLAEELRHQEPMEPWALARVVGEHADRVGRTDLSCDADSPEVDAAQKALTDLATELVSYCEFGPNPTPDAYLKACAALAQWRARAEAAEGALRDLKETP
jgi:hypothetical protein